MVLRREGERILARLSDRDHVIALCVDARQYESPELAAGWTACSLRAKAISSL